MIWMLSIIYVLTYFFCCIHHDICSIYHMHHIFVLCCLVLHWLIWKTPFACKLAFFGARISWPQAGKIYYLNGGYLVTRNCIKLSDIPNYHRATTIATFIVMPPVDYVPSLLVEVGECLITNVCARRRAEHCLL